MFSKAGVAQTITTVASYRDRAAVNAAASKLIAAEIDPKAITITGTGLESVERLIGKFTVSTALRNGAGNGLFFGLVLASFSLLFRPEAPPAAFLGMLLVGLATGLLLGVLSYMMTRRKRAFQSTTEVKAQQYDLGVTAAFVAPARKALGLVTEVTRPPVDLSEPPRYGERIAPSADATPETSADDSPAPNDE